MPEIAGSDWRKRAAEIKFEIAPFIDGAFAPSAASGVIEDINPATEKALTTFSVGDEDDARRAVGGARAAFDDGRWRLKSPVEKRATLLAFADLVAADAETLALLDTLEMGKPILNALVDAHSAARTIRFYAEACDKLADSLLNSDPQSLVFQRREPRGVVAAITPWNFPVGMAALKLAPALAAGNSVVLKPSELASASACRLASLAHAAGIPPGVLQVVPGLGAGVGQMLATHGDVDFVSFTGSTATGRVLQQACGARALKPLMLECGGKSPQIVLPDAPDLDAVAEAIAHRIFRNQGQVCSAGSRLIAHRSVVDRLVECIATHAGRYAPGDPLDPHVRLGPLVSAQQRRRVMDYVAAGKANGAQLVCGGGTPDRPGYYVDATVFTGVDPQSSIAREEIFGPVLCVFAFDTLDQAIALANATEYGLTTTLWTTDFAAAHRVCREVRAGRVSVNMTTAPREGAGYAMGSEPMRQSGFGAEGGLAGLTPYTTLKGVQFNV